MGNWASKVADSFIAANREMAAVPYGAKRPQEPQKKRYPFLERITEKQPPEEPPDKPPEVPEATKKQFGFLEPGGAVGQAFSGLGSLMRTEVPLSPADILNLPYRAGGEIGPAVQESASRLTHGFVPAPAEAAGPAEAIARGLIGSALPMPPREGEPIMTPEEFAVAMAMLGTGVPGGFVAKGAGGAAKAAVRTGAAKAGAKVGEGMLKVPVRGVQDAGLKVAGLKGGTVKGGGTSSGGRWENLRGASADETLGNIEDRIAGLEADLEWRRQLIRPRWAAPLTDEEIMAVAKHEGLDPFKPDWADSIDSQIIAGALGRQFKPNRLTMTRAEIQDEIASLKRAGEDILNAPAEPEAVTGAGQQSVLGSDFATNRNLEMPLGERAGTKQPLANPESLKAAQANREAIARGQAPLAEAAQAKPAAAPQAAGAVARPTSKQAAVPTPQESLNRYVALIRNPAKKTYALAYRDWVQNGSVGPAPERGKLSFMAAQSVRQEIDGLRPPTASVAPPPVAEAVPPLLKGEGIPPQPAAPIAGRTRIQQGPQAALPRDLAGAKPRYNIGTTSYEPAFASDVDKALFIVSQAKKSARDADYLAFLQRALPDVPETTLRNGEIRTFIKQQVVGEPAGPVRIPDSGLANFYKATPPKESLDKISDKEWAAIKGAQTQRVPRVSAPPPIAQAPADELVALLQSPVRNRERIAAILRENPQLRLDATQQTIVDRFVTPKAAPPVAAAGAPPQKPPTAAGKGNVPPSGKTPPPPSAAGQGISETLAQATAIVQRDQPRLVTRLVDYVPGAKQVQHRLLPALDMSDNMRAGWVGEGLAEGKVATTLQRSYIGQLQRLEQAFGKGATSTRDFAPEGVTFKGGTKAANATGDYTGTLADILERPSLYNLTPEQSAAIASIQNERSGMFRSVKDAYNLAIDEYPVEQGGMHIPHVDVSEDAIEMSGSIGAALRHGRSKERFYPTLAARLQKDPTFNPETIVAKLLAADDATLSTMAGRNTFLEGAGGKTKLQVMQETHPELAAKMDALRTKVQRIRSRQSSLRQQTQDAIDDFLASPMDDADLAVLQTELAGGLKAGRYVAKSQAGKQMADLRKEWVAARKALTDLQPAWRTANLKPYTVVQEAGYRYFPAKEADQVRNLLKTSNSQLLKVIDNLRATAFGGDLSPVTIQGMTAWFSDPVGVTRFVASGKGGFSQASMLEYMAKNPDVVKRFVGATGINPLGGVEQEFATGYLSRIPKVGKVWAAWNDGLYRPMTKMQMEIFEDSYQGALKLGLTAEQAAAIGADDATKIIPRYNFRRLGQSQADAAKYRAALTSVSFLTQPAALTTDAMKGLVKLATRQAITPSEKFAVKRVLTLVATTEAIAVTSNVLYAKMHGRDPVEAAMESLNPTSGKFMSLILPNGGRVGLGGPFRSVIRAVVPQQTEGFPLPLPFVGVPNFLRSKVGPTARVGVDLLRNKDYYGKKILTEDFPLNIMQGLEYAFEGSAPLTVGSAAQQVRHGESPGVVGAEVGSQFAGANYQPPDRAYELSVKWKPAFKLYDDIPTDPLKLDGGSSRLQFRIKNPELDAKLFVAGKVDSLQSGAAVTAAAKIIRDNEIDPDSIPSIAARKKKKATAKSLNVTLDDTKVDRLINALGKTAPKAAGGTTGTAPKQGSSASPPSSAAPTPSAAYRWAQVSAPMDRDTLAALSALWANKKPLTPMEDARMRQIFADNPLGQTNYDTWLKQTLRQLQENAANEGKR